MLSRLFVFALLGVATLSAADSAPRLSDYQREAGQIMLKTVRRDLEEHHFDRNLKGVKLDELVAAASARIAQAQSNTEVFRAIAGVTRAFGDSHTRFLPPRWGFGVNYGWRALPAGKGCFIYHVVPGSDAERRGVRVGDQLLAINGAAVSADTLSAWQYLLFAVEPLRSLRLTLVAPGGEPREVDVATKIIERQRTLDLRRDFNVLVREAEDRSVRGRNLYEEFDGVLVWRLKSFYSDEEITEGLKKMRGHDRLVLDLRGNPGGAVGQVLRVIAVLLGGDATLGVKRLRDRTEPLVAELRRETPWKGKLMVLIDRQSASGAELVAAAVQQRGRGLLLGDCTAGAVQESRALTEKVGVDPIVFFGVQVAISEVELEGGRKIEGVGVTPDFLMPLGGADIAARRDPVLARALKQLGVVRAPEQVSHVCWVFEARKDDPEAEQ